MTPGEEFDALLVGPPTTGGLIRHRARRVRRRARLGLSRLRYVTVRHYVSGRGTRVGLGVTFEPGMGRTDDSLRRSALSLLVGRLVIRVYW